MTPERMIPNIHDRETSGFFEAAARGKLVFRCCLACERAIHPPAPLCAHCGGLDTEWREAKGAGRLYAWTTVTHQVHAGYPTPYTVVVVELVEAPEVRVVGHLDGEPALAFGQPMEVWFEDVGDGATLPQWRPATADPAQA
jgi:uncharacterized OB-fold protein